MYAIRSYYEERLPLTFGMNVASLILTLAVAVPIGVVSARRQGGRFDKAMTVLVFIGFAMPGYWLALLLMYWLGIVSPILPISGLTTLGREHAGFWDLARITSYNVCYTKLLRHPPAGLRQGREPALHAVQHRHA